MNDSVKFKSVKVENVLKVKFAQLDFSNDKVTIGGENGAGKSSVAKAIWMAFAGKKGAPDWPVRDGEKKGKVTIELDNGLLLEAVISPSRDVTLTLKDAEGVTQRSPLDRLKEFNLQYGFYPQQFISADPKERAALLRKLCGIDTAKLDSEREDLYKNRTDINRDLKSALARYASLSYDSSIEGELDASILSNELGEALDFNSRRKGAISKVEVLKSKVDENLQTISRLQREIEESKAEIAKLETGLEKYPERDISAIQAKLSSITENNKKFASNKAYLSAENEVRELENKTHKISLDIEAIDRKKANLLSSIKFPIPSLSLEGDVVMLNKIPFDQASEAEKWKASIAIAFALNPKIKLVYVKDGSLLTQKTREEVYRITKEYGGQLLFEIAGDAPDVDVLMEDGEIIRG